MTKLLIYLLFISAFLAQPLIATASEHEGLTNEIIGVLIEPFGVDPSALFVWALGIGAVLAFGVIVYGGVLWSVSMGGEQKNQAKEWIKGAVYGMLLLAFSYLLLSIINPNLLKF